MKHTEVVKQKKLSKASAFNTAQSTPSFVPEALSLPTVDEVSQNFLYSSLVPFRFLIDSQTLISNGMFFSPWLCLPHIHSRPRMILSILLFSFPLYSFSNCGFLIYCSDVYSSFVSIPKAIERLTLSHFDESKMSAFILACSGASFSFLISADKADIISSEKLFSLLQKRFDPPPLIDKSQESHFKKKVLMPLRVRYHHHSCFIRSPLTSKGLCKRSCAIFEPTTSFSQRIHSSRAR